MPIKTGMTPDPSELKIALENRAFEITLFWQRSNYFLVLMTALGAGVFTIKDEWFSLLMAIFAAIGSFLWFRTNLGSRFWQESWEVEVNNLAKEQGIRSFERTHSEIELQVARALSGNARRSFLRRWIDQQIVKKPSVTFHMIILSLVATIVWTSVALLKGWRLGPKAVAILESLFSCAC